MAIKTRLMTFRINLFSKILITFTILSAIIFALLCSLYIVIEIKEKKVVLTENLSQEIRHLEGAVRLPLYAENQILLLREAENAFHLPEIKAVVITSATGKVLVNLHASDQTGTDAIVSKTVQVFSGNFASSVDDTLISNTDSKPVLIGSVRLDRATSDLSREIRYFVLYSTGLALICWILMIGTFYLILRKSTVSFNELMHGLRQMQNGEYSTRVRILSYDELGHAGMALNELAEKLHERSTESLRLNQDLLESKLNLRTLLDSNERDTQMRLSMASATALLFAWDINLTTGTITYSESVEAAFNNGPLSTDFYLLSKLALLFHDKDRAQVATLFEETISQTGLFDGQFRVKVDDETYIWIEAHGKIIHGSKGETDRIVGIGQNITERKQLEEAHRRVNALAQNFALAGERERCRIAEELHDQVGPNLLLCMMKLDSLRSQLPTDELDEIIEPIETIIENSIQEIRSLTFQLRPPILATAGLTPALKWLANEYQEKYGLNVTITDNALPLMMDFDIRSTLFQVVRELLLNIVKHARTNLATITIDREADLIITKVNDNGIGFDPAAKFVPKSDSMGFGMFNIRQKIEHIGGSIQFDSESGSGTLVTVTVPEQYVVENIGELI